MGQKVTLVRRNSVETGGDFLAEIPPENITVFPKGSQIIQTSTEILIEIAYEPTVFLFR